MIFAGISSFFGLGLDGGHVPEALSSTVLLRGDPTQDSRHNPNIIITLMLVYIPFIS